MKSHIHAKNSQNKYGGKESDYIEIHTFMDSTKAHFADVRHRAILHNSWGVFLCEKIFGTTIKNSDKKVISVRDIAEDHVMEDLGFIPTISDYLKGMEYHRWLWGNRIPEENIDKIREEDKENKDFWRKMLEDVQRHPIPTIPTIPDIPNLPVNPLEVTDSVITTTTGEDIVCDGARVVHLEFPEEKIIPLTFPNEKLFPKEDIKFD